MDSHQIILAPVLTEKAIADQKRGRFHLWVYPKASKTQIKRAVKQLFGVEAVEIRTILQKGKRKRLWRQNKLIQKPDRKKALIQLAAGEKIDLAVFKQKK